MQALYDDAFYYRNGRIINQFEVVAIMITDLHIHVCGGGGGWGQCTDGTLYCPKLNKNFCGDLKKNKTSNWTCSNMSSDSLISKQQSFIICYDVFHHWNWCIINQQNKSHCHYNHHWHMNRGGGQKYDLKWGVFYSCFLFSPF